MAEELRSERGSCLSERLIELSQQRKNRLTIADRRQRLELSAQTGDPLGAEADAATREAVRDLFDPCVLA